MALEVMTAEQACSLADDLEGVANTLHDCLVPRGGRSREVRQAFMAVERARRIVDNLANFLSTDESYSKSQPSTTGSLRGDQA